MQDDPRAESALAALPDPTRGLTPALHEAIEKSVERAVEAQAAKGKLTLASIGAWKWMAALVCLISAFIMGAVLLDEVNLIDLWYLGTAADPVMDPADDAQPAGFSDVLSALLPLFTIAIAFFVGATGLQRLALYDDQFATARTERREDMADLRREMAETTKASREALDADLNAATERQKQFEDRLSREIKETATKVAEDSYKSVRDEITKSRSELSEIAKAKMTEIDDKVDFAYAKIDGKTKQLEWILIEEQTTEALSEGSVRSASDLFKLVRQLFDVNNPRAAVTLIEQSLKQDLRGIPDDYFNISTELARRGLATLAFEIAKCGLRYYSNNADLLAGALRFAAAAGAKDEGQEIFQRLASLPEVEKGWRARVFAADFLKDTQGITAAEDYLLNYVDRFFDRTNWGLKPVLPSDGFSERVAAKLLEIYEGTDRAAEIEQIALAVLNAGFKAPQTAATLARFYRNTGKSAEAIKVADRAIRDDAFDQTSTSLSAILHVKANAYDTLFLTAAEQDSGDWKGTLELARRAFINYTATLSSSDRLVNPAEISLRANAIITRLVEIGVDERTITALIPKDLRSLVNIPGTNAASASDGNDSGHNEGVQAVILGYLRAALEISQLPDDEIREKAAVDLAKRIATEHSGDSNLVAVQSVLADAAKQYAEDQPDFARVLDMVVRRLAN